MARTNLFLAYNARIWSGDPKSDYVWFTFNIATGYIEEVGSCNPPVTDFDVTHRRDYAGRRIFPGFHESHIHLGGLGSYLTNLDLQGCKSMDALKVWVFFGHYEPIHRCFCIISNQYCSSGDS